MVVVNGRIVNFIIDRDKTGYAEFIFKSDYDRDCPRFEAICSGEIPDVVPGVPIKVEFYQDSIDDITKIDFREMKIEKITKFVKDKYMNKTAYTCINFKDEEYAKSILLKVKGISVKTANRILDAVDGDITRLSGTWDDAEFWKGVKGSKRYLSELKSTIGSMMEKDTMVQKYKKYGIGYPQAEMLISMYEMEAEDMLCKHPYTVFYRLEFDFQVADNFAKDMGFHYLNPERIRAIIYQVLNDNEANGNTAMSRRDFYIACARLHKVSAWKDYVVSPYCILAEFSEMKSVYCENDMIGYIRTMNMESDIAFQIKRLMASSTPLNTPENVFDEIKDKYNKEQMEFLKAFDKNSVMILLGRGGTGKTHTICGAIDLFKRRYPKEEVRLCAPTARAAGVLKEHSGHESSTIHILLELKPYEDEEAGRNEDNPLTEKLIVVDEMSMVDTKLMYHLLRAIKSGAKLILSGDPDQLESVGCGAVLRDLIDSDMIPKIKLKKIMRQNEGSAVIENCGKILAGRYNFTENDSFKIRACKTEEEARAYLKSCYDKDAVHSQILSTTKKGIAGTMSLNHDFEDTEIEGLWLHGDHFKKGDKVVFSRNNYDTGYCNGDIGFIKELQMPLLVELQGENPKMIEINRDDTVDMEHADVITIHKSQGSEYDNVYIMLPDRPVSLLTRNMVNTAVSRARKNVTLITVNEALKTAASNRYKKNRITRLKEKLKNMEDKKCQEEEKQKQKSTH